MERHKNRWLYLADPGTVLSDPLREELEIEILRGEKRGPFHSAHEMSAVLREEFEEFWESVREDDPDPHQLLQVAAVALCAMATLSEWAMRELELAPGDKCPEGEPPKLGGSLEQQATE